MCNDIDTDATFEVLRKAVSEARRAQGRDQRFVRWVGDSRKLAYARDHRGRWNCSFLKSRWNLA